MTANETTGAYTTVSDRPEYGWYDHVSSSNVVGLNRSAKREAPNGYFMMPTADSVLDVIEAMQEKKVTVEGLPPRAVRYFLQSHSFEWLRKVDFSPPTLNNPKYVEQISSHRISELSALDFLVIVTELGDDAFPMYFSMQYENEVRAFAYSLNSTTVSHSYLAETSLRIGETAFARYCDSVGMSRTAFDKINAVFDRDKLTSMLGTELSELKSVVHELTSRNMSIEDAIVWYLAAGTLGIEQSAFLDKKALIDPYLFMQYDRKIPLNILFDSVGHGVDFELLSSLAS
jgi:hypothetical protein